MESSVKFTGGMSFEAELDGHKIKLDADEKFGGRDLGPRPKGLILVALMGCTGMDTVSLLKKMKVEFDDFQINVESRLTEDHPKYLEDIKLVFKFKLSNIDKYKKKIEKAVTLSQERYCGVSYMISKSSNLDYKIEYEES